MTSYQKCVDDLVKKSGNKLSAKEASGLLDRVSRTFVNKDGIFDLDRALTALDDLKANTGSLRERHLFNNMRLRMLSLKKQQAIISSLEGYIDKGVSPSRAFRIYTDGAKREKFLNPETGKMERIPGATGGARQRMEASIRIFKKSVDEVVLKHKLIGMNREQEDDFLRGLWHVTKGEEVSEAFSSALADLKIPIEDARVMLNAGGADITHMRTVLFNDPIDPVLINMTGGRQTFDELWTLENLDLEGVKLIQARLQGRPELSAAQKAYAKQLGGEQGKKVASAKFSDLSEEVQFQITKEAVFDKLSSSSKRVDNIALTDAKVNVPNGVQAVGANLVRQLDDINLIPFKDFDTYKQFNQAYSRPLNSDGMLTRIRRLGRFMAAVDEFGASPLQTIEAVTSWLREGKTKSKQLNLFSMRDRAAMAASMQSHSTEAIKLNVEDGQIIALSDGSTTKGKKVKLRKAVFNRHTGKEIQGDFFKPKTGEIDPSKLPLRVPGVPALGRLDLSDLAIEETALAYRNGIMSIFDRLPTPGIPEWYLMNSPENILKSITGESIYEGYDTWAATASRTANAITGSYLLTGNALTQLNDIPVAIPTRSRLSKGGMSGNLIQEYGSQLVGLLGHTTENLLNLLSTGPWGRLSKLEKLQELDTLGFMVESQTVNVLSNSFDFGGVSRLELGNMNPLEARTQKLTEVADKISMVSRINLAYRATAMDTVGRFAQLAKENKLTKGQIEFLADYDLTPQDVASAYRVFEGRPVFDPSLNKDAKSKLAAFGYDQVAYMVGLIDSGTRTARTRGHGANTKDGALYNAVTYLQSYTVNFAANVVPYIRNSEGILGGVMPMLIGLGMFGIAVRQAKQAISGEGFTDYSQHPWQLALDALYGIALPYVIPAEVIKAALTRGNIDAKTVLGPTIGLGFDVVAGGIGVSKKAANVAVASATGSENTDEAWEDLMKALQSTAGKNTKNASRSLAPMASVIGAPPAVVGLSYIVGSAWYLDPIRQPALRALEKSLDPKGYARRAKNRYNTLGNTRTVFDPEQGEFVQENPDIL